MRVSYAWLSELVPGLPAPEALSERLLHLGLEAASLERRGPSFTGVVVGEVLTKDKHPNADRLSVCTVSDGSKVFPVVCGAPNVAAGQRVAFAKDGARLPNDFRIKKSKIRGAVSEGMICSAKELGLPENGHDGILVLPADAPVGRDYAELLGPGDVLLDLEIGPNRPDCLSHLGLARELAVHFGLELKSPAAAPVPSELPVTASVLVSDPSACPRYVGRLLEGLRIGPSAAPVRARLEALGLRAINNAVDATNYLLLENGQPLHVFDADKLSGGLSVREARAGERLKALDGKEYVLEAGDLVIADDSGPVALAGVIGGEPTGVTESTTRVFLECARFAPGRVRRTARRLGLRTDSSIRFERGVDPAAQAERAERAAAFILEACGGAAGAPLDTAPAAPVRPLIVTTAAEMNAILGTSHPSEKVEGVLRRVAADVREAGESLGLVAPSWRLDLASPEDLAEEVARHLGYAGIPEEAGPARLPVPTELPVPALAERLCDALAGLGFQEAFNYDFLSEPELDRLGVSEGLARLLNPLSEDWAALRPTLLGGLMRNAVLNQNRGVSGGRLFESGRTYRRGDRAVSESSRLSGIWWGGARPHWKRKESPAPEIDELRGLLAALLRGFVLEERPGAEGAWYHPKAAVTLLARNSPVGRAGELHPRLLEAWELKGPAVAFELDLDALAADRGMTRGSAASGVVGAAAGAPVPRFRPASPFPSVERDLSLFVPETLEFRTLDSAIRSAAGDSLTRVDLIDVFTAEGRTSWTLRLTFSRLDRTLTDADVSTSMTKVQAASGVLGAVPRT